jgi:hypothetical protein
LCRRAPAHGSQGPLHRDPSRSHTIETRTCVLPYGSLASPERGARLLLRHRDPRNRLHYRDGQAVQIAAGPCTRRCARPSCSPIWVLTPPPSIQIASDSWLLDIGFPALSLASRCGSETVAIPSWRAVRAAGRPHVTSERSCDRRFSIASFASLLRDCRPCRGPVPIDVGHDARGGPVAFPQSLERLSSTSARVRA